jgi:hypothetical protein
MKISKKVVMLVLVCIMTISQTISAFAVQYRVYEPVPDSEIVKYSSYNKYVKGRVYINVRSYLKIGCWMNYSVRGSKVTSTKVVYSTIGYANNYSANLCVASGLVGDGRTYRSAGTEGYYGSSGDKVTNYMGYQSILL